MPDILLIEDEDHLREVIGMNLELEGFRVFSYSDAINIKSILEDREFDLILLDVMLPEMDGYGACAIVKEVTPNVPVMFLTARSATEDRILGLKTGADDYLTKPFHLEELILRVKNLLKRNNPASLNIYEFDGNKVDFEAYKGTSSEGEVYDLSKREIQLLKLLTEKAEKVVSRDEILEKLWPDGSYPSPRVIDNFILNFRKIFENHPSKLKYFHSVRGVGYRFSPKGEK